MPSVVYYRISDGMVIGSTTSPYLPDVEVELSNYGVGISSLRVEDAQAMVQTGKRRKVMNGSLVHEDDPDYLNQKQKRKNALDKIKLKLNLTEDEFNLIFGG